MRAVLILAAGLAVAMASPEIQTRIGCEECVQEMRRLGDIVRHHGPGMEERVRQGYCPTLDVELLEQCEEHLAHNYVLMLDMIVEHFFVDGAQHICQAWGACHPYKTAGQPRE